MSKINYNLCKLTLYDKKKILNDPQFSELIVLDINNEDKSDKYSYFSRNDYKEYAICTGNYVNKIQQGDFVIWESCNKNDCSHLVLFYDGDDKYIVIVPYEGNLILLHKSSDGSWINIKTEVDLNKLHVYGTSGFYLNPDYFYYDLKRSNLQILFDTYCEIVVYSGRLIYDHCDNPMYGHLYSLCFNLLDSTLSIHLSNDSIMTIPCPKAQMHVKTNSINLYQGYDCYKTSHFTFKRELKDCKDEKVVKKLKLDEGKPKYICIYECNFYDDTFDVNAIHVFLDSNMIMSTDKYVTYCSGGYRDFNIKKGFIFAKVENGPEISYDTFYQGYYDLQINATRSFYQLTENRDLEYNPRYNADYLGKMRPDITKLKFYTKDNIEISSDDCDVSYDDFFYVIKFKTSLYKIVYDDKEYWNYNNDNSNGFPNKIYFTDYNNDMNVCFNDGKIQKVKIKVHFLKLYTTDEFGNRVQIDDNQYRITKPFKDQRMYKFKEGVKCTEIWHYEYELAWKHKHGDPYPSSFTYDNYMFSISLRFETYFIVSLRGRCNKIWIPMVYYIPKHFKLFQLNENGENLELNEKHYDLTCSHFGSIKYNIKESVECDEIKFDDVTIYKRKQSEQYPYTMTYYTCMPLVTGLCSNLSIRCERKKGIWKTYLREVTDIRKKFRR